MASWAGDMWKLQRGDVGHPNEMLSFPCKIQNLQTSLPTPPRPSIMLTRTTHLSSRRFLLFPATLFLLSSRDLSASALSPPYGIDALVTPAVIIDKQRMENNVSKVISPQYNHPHPHPH